MPKSATIHPPTATGVASSDVVATPAADNSTSSTWVLGLLGLMAAAHGPLIIRLGARLWANEHYQFFPLVLAGAGYVVWQRVQAMPEAAPGRRWLRDLLLLFGLVFLLAAIALDSPLISGISLLVNILAVCYAAGGGTWTRHFLAPWLYCWLIIPPPFGLDQQLVLSLQWIATRWASSVLDLLGYTHLLEGVVLQLPERAFEVEQACSGIHSLFAVLSCAALYLILSGRGFLRSIFMLATAVLCVVIANSARVVLVTTLNTTYNLPIAEGVGHQMAGILTFAFAVALLASTDRLGVFLVPERDPFAGEAFASVDRRRKSKVFGFLNRHHRSKTARFAALSIEGVVLIGALAALAVLQLRDPALDLQPAKQIAMLEASHEELLPAEIDGWRRTDFQYVTRDKLDINGRFSQVWTYERGATSVKVSLDGPFVGFHDLSRCFVHAGWTVTNTTTSMYADHAAETESKEPGGCTELTVTNGPGRFGFCVFGMFDESHRPYVPPETKLGYLAVRRFPQAAELMKRLLGNRSETTGRDDANTYQLQVVLSHSSEFSESQLDPVRDLYHRLRVQMAAQAAR